MKKAFSHLSPIAVLTNFSRGRLLPGELGIRQLCGLWVMRRILIQTMANKITVSLLRRRYRVFILGDVLDL